MIEEGVGENQGGVGFAEVEFDSPTLGEVANRYMVGLYKTLFDRGHPKKESIVLSRDTDYEHTYTVGVQQTGSTATD